MTWLTPALAGLVAAIAVPSLIILYFLKLRRREIEVSSTLLWQQAIRDLQANAPFQKLRRNILLILQLLALAAAIVAVAQPQRRGGPAAGERLVILIDRSASMNSVDADQAQSRLDAAKVAAIELVKSMREPTVLSTDTADLAMVIAFDSGAEVRTQFTSDKARLRQAIEGIEPTDAPTRLAEGLRLATAHASSTIVEGRGLVSGPGAAVHVFSDGRIPDAADVSVRKADTLVFHPVGSAQSWNMGITGVRVERGFENPDRATVFVGIQSTSPTPRPVDVELTVEGAVLGVKRVDLPGAAPATGGAPARPARAGIVFEFERAEPGAAAIRLLDTSGGGIPERPAGDSLGADDIAWLSVPPARRLSAALVTRGNVFIPAMLDVLPLATTAIVSPDDYEKWRADGRAGGFDVIIFDGWLPDAPLAPGRYLIFNATPRNCGLTETGTAEGLRVVDWQRTHPALEAVNLDAVDIAAMRVLTFDASLAPAGAIVETLAETTRGPAILEASTVDWRAIVAPFDLTDTDWVFDHGLLVFLSQSVSHLSGSGATASSAIVQPGGLLADRLPAGVTEALIRTPSGDEERLVVGADGNVVFGPLRLAGMYEVSWEGEAGTGDRVDGDDVTRLVAANLLDPEESDIAAAKELNLASQDATVRPAAETPAARRLWPLLVALALAVVALEWWIYNRLVHL